MMTDPGNEKSILSELQHASRTIALKRGALPEDVVSLVVADIWEQTDAPPEVLKYLTCKMESLSENSLRRMRRAKQRLHKCERTRQGQQSRHPRDVIEYGDLKRIRDVAMENCTDPLDRDLVLVLMEEHPVFENPFQVFQSYGICNSAGYRRLSLLKDRLRLHLSALDLSN